MTKERYLSVHIEKTGGLSLRRFFVDLYGPQEVFFYDTSNGFIRADQLPAMKRLTPRVDRVKMLLLVNPVSRLLYPYIRKVIKALENPTVETQIPEEFSIIHGHFSPGDIAVDNAKLVTVFREPLNRTLSHFRFWLDSHAKGISLPSWFDPEMHFEDFALSSHMSNLQARYVGEDGLEQFEHVGVTRQLNEYCQFFDPTQSTPLPWLNRSRKTFTPDLNEAFIKQFRSNNVLDYAFYSQALERVGQ